MCVCRTDKRVGWQQRCEYLQSVYLFQVHVEKDLEDDDWIHKRELVIARNESEAIEKVKDMNDYRIYRGGFIKAKKIDQLDGYRIEVKSK